MGTHPIFESDFDCLTEDEYLPTFRRFVAFGGDRHLAAQDLEDEIVRRCLRKNTIALRRLFRHKIY